MLRNGEVGVIAFFLVLKFLPYFVVVYRPPCLTFDLLTTSRCHFTLVHDVRAVLLRHACQLFAGLRNRMGSQKRVVIFEDSDSNLAGFELVVRFTVHKLANGKIVLSRFKSGEGYSILGRFTDGALLWEDLAAALSEEGYDSSWIDLEQTAKVLRRCNREFAWQFATAPHTESTRLKQKSDRLARLLITNSTAVSKEIAAWVGMFRHPFQEDLRQFVADYIATHRTLPSGVCRVAWDFLVDFEVLRRRLYEIDAKEDEGFRQ